MATSGNAELDGFIAKFTPEVSALAHALLEKARAQLSGAIAPGYDNDNARATGFGPTDRVKDIVFSFAVMPRWVTLCFMWGTRFDDPKKLLDGKGSQARNIRLHAPEAQDDPDVQGFIAQALANAIPPVSQGETGGIVIKSVSTKQRPRRLV